MKCPDCENAVYSILAYNPESQTSESINAKYCWKCDKVFKIKMEFARK